MHKPEDYKTIHAWGIMMGSFEYYIVNEQKLAAKHQAPLNATFYTENAGWFTIDSCHAETQLRIQNILATLKS